MSMLSSAGLIVKTNSKFCLVKKVKDLFASLPGYVHHNVGTI